MVPVRLYIEDPDYYNEGLFIDTDLPVVPQKGDRIVLKDFSCSQLSTDFVKRMAEYINAVEAFEEICEPYPILTNRPVEDYKDEVIEAINHFGCWSVEETAIGTKRLYVYLSIL